MTAFLLLPPRAFPCPGYDSVAAAFPLRLPPTSYPVIPVLTDLQYAVYSRAMGCTRHYYVIWCVGGSSHNSIANVFFHVRLHTYPLCVGCRYDKLVRAGLRLPPPYWEGPPVPGHNETHDALVKVWRVENKVIPPMG